MVSAGDGFSHSLRVRYNECDSQGHVFNANYLIYFDIAITELWRTAFGSYQALLDEGLDLVVAEAGLRYRSPARFDDQIAVRIGITRLGNTALSTSLTVAREATVLVEGEMRHVFVRAGTTEKAPIPAATRVRLEPYLLAEAHDAGADGT